MRSVKTLAQRVLSVSRITAIVALALVFSCLAVYTYTRVTTETGKVYAATSSTLNFQGRLLNADGSLVSDGLYNLEFKLYDGGTQGGPGGAGEANAGTLLWTETRDYNGGSPDNRVRVVNGYFTANLGSVTAFGTSIDWDQELWITMNVGGSGTLPSWDGEMLATGNKRTKLTAVPYAFQAGSAKRLIDEQLSGTGTLEWLALTGNRTVSLPDASGTVLLDSTGFANGGNNFSSGTATLGTNNSNDLILETNNSEGLRIDQDGDVSIGTGADASEKLEVNGGLKIGNSTGSNAGTIRWTGTDFEGYNGSQWVSLTLASSSTSANFVSSSANTAANGTGIAAGLLSFTSAAAVSSTAGSSTFVAPASGSFRSCMVVGNANRTAGTATLRWRVNGVSVGTGVCVIDGTNIRTSSQIISPNVVTFNAGDTIAVALDTVGLAPGGSTEYTVYWSVDYGSSGANGTFYTQGGNTFGSTAIFGTTDNQGLSVITNNVEALAISNTGAAQFAFGLSVANNLQVLAGGAVITGGIDNNSGGITEAGAISGVTTLAASGAISAATATDTINGLVINAGSLSSITGFTQGGGTFSFSNSAGAFTVDSSAFDVDASGAVSGLQSLTGSGALAISSGGAGALTLDSASGVLVLAANDTTLQRIASGTYTIDLSDGAATTLSLNNSGAGAASLNLVDGGLQVNGTSVLTNGRALQNLTGLTVTSGGADITGGINANSGTISNVGTISGSAGVIDFTNFDLASSGAVTLTGNLTLSGDANEGISGGGLTDCDGTYSKLQWDSTTNKFLCSTDLAQMVHATDAVNTTWADNNTTDLWNGVEPSITIQAGSEVLVLANFRATGDPGSQNVELAARIDREGAGVASDCADVNTVGTTFSGTYTDNAAGDPVALITSSTSFVDAPGGAGTYTYAFCTSADTVIGGGTWTENGLNLTLYEVNDAADLAEVYPTSDNTLAPGEVVVLDPSGRVSVSRSSKAYDSTAIGVIATKPGLVIGGTDGESQYGKPVALAGRVPVKVTAQNGAIKKGDFLTSSSIPGVAMKATKSGPVIGIAMGDYSGNEVGTVMVFVQNGTSNGTVDRSKDSKSLLQELVAGRSDILAKPQEISSINTDRIAAGLELVTPRVVADTVETNRIAVDEDGLQFVDEQGREIASVTKDGIFNFRNVQILGEQGLDYGSELNNLKARVDALDKRSSAVANIADTSINLQGLTVNLDLIARGSLVVEGKSTFKEMARFEKDAQFDANVEVKGEIKTNSDTAGIARIKEGEKKVKIEFAKRKSDKPIITLSLGGATFIQYSYQNVTEEGFEIVLSGPAPKDLEFSWIALQTTTPVVLNQP